MSRQLALEFRHPGRCSGGNDDLKIGHAGLKGSDELSANVDLAHAYCMRPEDVPVRDRLFELGIVFGKTLWKTSEPIPSSPHSQKVIRRRQDKKNCKQDVVKGAHSTIPHLLEIMGKKSDLAIQFQQIEDLMVGTRIVCA